MAVSHEHIILCCNYRIPVKPLMYIELYSFWQVYNVNDTKCIGLYSIHDSQKLYALSGLTAGKLRLSLHLKRVGDSSGALCPCSRVVSSK